MIEKKPLDTGDAAELTFVVPAQQVMGEVSVVGDFNDWDVKATPLKRSGEQLIASVTVPTGQRYAFRYYNRGDWFNDETADAYEPNEFGGYNCVIDLTSES